MFKVDHVFIYTAKNRIISIRFNYKINFPHFRITTLENDRVQFMLAWEHDCLIKCE